ncbi:MAG: response regulator [Candidatus Latescibacterota bacterium]
MNAYRALVIDDNQIVLESVSKILSEENCQVDTAQSSREGLDRAIRGEYDIVLTDVRMPQIGGMRVLRDIRRAKPSVPVVIITGYATVQSAVQAMKLGAADYLQKPFTPDELLKTVAAALDVKSTRRPPEEQSLIHRKEVLAVLGRVSRDSEFASELLRNGVDVLEEYDLTGPEKLALLTGDLAWIEEHLGPLEKAEKKWFEIRSSGEVW